MCSPLFEWVIENLCKNAIDAMNGEGSITIRVTQTADHAYIDVEDTGKGIHKSHFQSVFSPGFTTKRRGWGLGLSLAKRIIESYHKGRIYVKHSELGKGTTFRIELKK
jgi:signal transduction histidine kinase